MRDLYVVYEDGNELKCVFHAIVLRNKALADKYPGGLKAFTEKQLSKCNRDLTVYCDMGSDIEAVWRDLVKNGLSPEEDFIGFDATSHTMGLEMSGNDNTEEAIEFTVPWLEGRCTREGAYVWFSEKVGSLNAVDIGPNDTPLNASENALDIELFHHEHDDFQRLKRKKWNWQFLASGYVTWNMASSGKQSFNIGNTQDKRHWALQDLSWNRKIVVIAEIEDFQAKHVSEIALQLLRAYDNNSDSLLRQMTEFGKIKLPSPGKTSGSTPKRRVKLLNFTILE